jgi:hypothetical protein
VKISDEVDDARIVAVQSLSNVQLIKLLQFRDEDDELTEMIEYELTRRKTDGAPPQ